ncbi:MAG: hypothetical protein NTV88_04905 [Candidatus Micrarchaeota archaeon]|nr:hypothetical protein [Candidatus Micrarchaeota archaeon]
MADKTKEVKEAKKAENAGKNSMNMLIAAAAIIVVLVAAYFYFNPAGSAPPNGTPPVQINQMDTQAAKIMLASFDKGAALQKYTAAYSTTDSGGTILYDLVKNETNSWVHVTGNFGSLQGFFGKDNKTDTVCLTYNKMTRCAIAGDNQQAQAMASNLKVLLLNQKAYTDQKAQTLKLIRGGVITFDPKVSDETVGQFSTQKITYMLNYRNLTVKQIQDMALPNDPTLFSAENWQVSFWVDKASGMVVKSKMGYTISSDQFYYETEHTKLDVNAASVPEVKDALISTAAFVEFYKSSQADYSAILTCQSAPAAQADGCYKSVATDRRDSSLCKKIKAQTEFEACTLIVAEATAQSSLCSNLTLYSDDCYIAVAGKTGDFGLCQNVKNQSLLNACSQAATEGKKAADAAAAAKQALENSKNCAINADCKTAGNVQQYCVPMNSNLTYGIDNSPQAKCLKNIPCGCQSGFCGFAKNETYYKCVNDVEDAALQQFIENETKKANPAVNLTNSTNMSK